MTQKTWFDAFFQALTSSPEFKSVMEKDYKKDFWKRIDSMKTWVSKATSSLKEARKNLKKSQNETREAGSIYEQLNNQFSSPEAMQAAEKYTWLS